MSTILAHVYRGDLKESSIRGDWVITDNEGSVKHHVGDPEKVTFWRSSAKPFQALGVVKSGASEKYNFSQAELSVMCASHIGEEYHTEAVRSILQKIGLSESYLQCGVHPPYHKESADALTAKGQLPSSIHSNCSGKHAGMLALCQYHGWDPESYLEIHHPVQKETLELISVVTETPTSAIHIGVDGCGVPVFGLTLRGMARAWAHLASPSRLPLPLPQAAKVIADAMRAYPQYVSGTGMLCTLLMRAYASEGLVSKAGAEGVYCLGLPRKGVGLALKIEDGSARAIPAIILEILDGLGILPSAPEELKDYRPLLVKNHREQVVGEIKAEVYA